MKEWFAALLALSLLDRRKRREFVQNDRRRITPKKAQKMLDESLSRFSDVMNKFTERKP